MVFIHLTVGCVILLPVVSLPTASSVSSAWRLLLVIGFVHTGLMSVLLYSAVQKIPTMLVGGLAFIYPVVAILIDAWVLHRPLNGWQLTGTLIVLAAVAGINIRWRFSPKVIALILLINALCWPALILTNVSIRQGGFRLRCNTIAIFFAKGDGFSG